MDLNRGPRFPTPTDYDGAGTETYTLEGVGPEEVFGFVESSTLETKLDFFFIVFPNLLRPSQLEHGKGGPVVLTHLKGGRRPVG